MSRLSRKHRSFVAAAGSLVLAATGLMGTPSTSAAPASSADHASAGHAASQQVVASGLDNPRLLSFAPSGALYVAEAGKGGHGPCFVNPRDEKICFGRSGAVTRIKNGHQSRILSRQPSLSEKGGFAAIGPADVSVRAGRYAVTIGLENDPAVRDGLPPAGQRLGALLRGRLGSGGHVLRNLATYEATHNPDGGVPDSDPTGFARARHGSYVVTDAGGNDLLRVGRHGKVRVLAVFPTRTVPFPFPPPDTIEMESVPTSVIHGSDGAWYVSELTGFPFPANRARIYRVVPGHAPRIVARGLTNVTDLAWWHGNLYAVQIAGDAGLLAVPDDELPMGSLVKIRHNGTTKTVVGDLPAPYGVAIRRGHAYITTCSICPGNGRVVRVPLR
jgi:hypothetical protein